MVILDDHHPVSIIYAVRARLAYKLRVMRDLDEREIAFIEDELFPCMDKYIKVAEDVYEEEERLAAIQAASIDQEAG